MSNYQYADEEELDLDFDVVAKAAEALTDAIDLFEDAKSKMSEAAGFAAEALHPDLKKLLESIDTNNLDRAEVYEARVLAFDPTGSLPPELLGEDV